MTARPSKWNVRGATLLDAEAVRAVAMASWRDAYAGMLRSATIEAFFEGPYALVNVRARIVADDVLVIDGPNGIVAFADAVPEADRVFLDAIYVRPEHHRRGAGSALVDAVAARHPGLPIDANVLVGNRKGEPFYERQGFVPVATLNGELVGEPITERHWRRPARGVG